MKCKILLSALTLIFSVSLCAFAGGTVEQPPTYGDVVVTEKAQQPIFDVPGEYMITTYDVVQGVDFVMPVNQVTLRTDFVAETYNLTLSGFADACKDVMTFAQAHQRFRQTNTYLFPDNRRCYLRLSDQAKSTDNQMYAPGKWKRWVMAQRK